MSDKNKNASGGQKSAQTADSKKGPCPWRCNLIPKNVPTADEAQTVLHPRKDVFVVKVAKVGAQGDRRCKMELELVTPPGFQNKVPGRVDTRETQCDPDPPPCWCSCQGRRSKNKKKKSSQSQRCE